MRYFHSLSAILVAVGLIGTPRLAQAQLSESPITPGFLSFANRKSETAQNVIAACRNYIEIRFADGHYIGLRIYKTDLALLCEKLARSSSFALVAHRLKPTSEQEDLKASHDRTTARAWPRALKPAALGCVQRRQCLNEHQIERVSTRDAHGVIRQIRDKNRRDAGQS